LRAYPTAGAGAMEEAVCNLRPGAVQVYLRVEKNSRVATASTVATAKE